MENSTLVTPMLSVALDRQASVPLLPKTLVVTFGGMLPRPPAVCSTQMDADHRRRPLA